MCDPVSLVVGAVGATVVGKAMAPKAPRAAAAPDPEAERMKAEADAAGAANRKLAADKMRRREQQSLVARGAPSLGDEQNTGQGVINTNSAEGLNAGSAAVSRRFKQPSYSTTSQGSLMSRGATQASGREWRPSSRSTAL